MRALAMVWTAVKETKDMAGIAADPKAPGFKNIIMAPKPDKRVGFVKADCGARRSQDTKTGPKPDTKRHEIFLDTDMPCFRT